MDKSLVMTLMIGSMTIAVISRDYYRRPLNYTYAISSQRGVRQILPNRCIRNGYLLQYKKL